MNVAKIANHKDLVAWQKGMDLVEMLYRLSAGFPADERFGLTAQVRWAGVSIPSNIAEGFGRSGLPDYLRFLDMAVGSANEVETQLLIVIRLGFLQDVDAQEVLDLTIEIQKILKGLIRSLRRSSKQNVRS